MKIVEGPVKFAVLGCGHIGKRHAEMITRHENAELVALCDIRSKEETGAGAYEVPYFTSFEEMLKKIEEIDVVCICTPNGLHAQQSLQALEQGCHIVCEKPMALTKADCEEVIFKALQVKKQVFCVMQNRYSPPSQWIKEVVSTGILGKIYIVQINCYWNRDQRYYFPNGEPHPWKGTRKLDGGTLFTQFSHFVDIMYWLFGDIKDIKGQFANFNHEEAIEFEDSGMVSFKFVNGSGMGCINYSTSVAGSNLESSMTIIGEKGSVKIGGQYMNDIEACNIEGYTMPELSPTNPANDYGLYKGSAANHGYVIENVVDVLTGNKMISTNALEGLKIVEIIERIYSVKYREEYENQKNHFYTSGIEN